MKRALIVGIDHYGWSPLEGCVNDAKSMFKALSENHSGGKNFHCKLLTSDKVSIERSNLRGHLDELFEHEGDNAIFYFAGHGSENDRGGYLVTQDAKQKDKGIPISELIDYANHAIHIKEILIILDCCYGGKVGEIFTTGKDIAVLRKGVSILTASQRNQKVIEEDGAGLFTRILTDGLMYGTGDILGHVTSASLYSYADNLLGPWDQRPMFKTHINQMNPIRIAEPKITIEVLRRIVEYFTSFDKQLRLNPSYEPTAEPANVVNEDIFGELQLMNSLGLVVPVEKKHMYDTAIHSKHCELTNIGRMYWKMVKNGKL